MTTTHDSPDNRADRGRALLEQVQGEDAARAIVDGFDAVSPDFGRYVLEAGFADVYGRAGLSLQQRQLLNVAVLTAIGGAENQLRTHLRGALHVGVSPTEILEAVFHVALYAGHPRAGNGFAVVREIFEEQGIDPLTVGKEN